MVKRKKNIGPMVSGEMVSDTVSAKKAESVSDTNKRVVITGLGVVSSIGIGWEEFWKNLIAGKSGISRVEAFDVSKYERQYAGEIKNFNAAKFMNKRKAELIGRSSQLAIAASKLAIKDAGVKLSDLRKKRFCLCLGTTMGEARVIETIVEGYAKMDKITAENIKALSYPSNSIITNVTNHLKLSGYNLMFANACAAGNYAITHAYDLIRQGKVSSAMAGGVDSLSRIAFTGFGRMFAMAPDKCRPFDKNRKGMMLGEGAGIVFMESLESAQKRKAKIYAEVVGYGLSCDAQHMTNPSAQGIEQAIRKSMKDAGINPKDVDYISAHGTGTPENDKAECEAMKNVMCEMVSDTVSANAMVSDTVSAKTPNRCLPPISSIKSMLGHTMGAASAIEAIACALSIKEGIIPPTINYEEKDPACDIDCVPNKARKHVVKIALNNSSAFGGNNACVVLKKV